MSLSFLQYLIKEPKQFKACVPKDTCAVLLLFSLLFGSYDSLAATTIDRLIVLHKDAEHYTTQISLHSEHHLINLALPKDRLDLGTHFYGPEKLTFKQAHRLNPHNVAIWSGFAMTRYQHNWDTTQKHLLADEIQLSIPVDLSGIDTEGQHELVNSITWLLPNNARYQSILGHHSINELNANPTTTGNWSQQGRKLSYSGPQLNSGVIKISFSNQNKPVVMPCDENLPKAKNCEVDDDNDGTPDYRDLCIGPAEQLHVTTKSLDSLGCGHTTTLVLQGVQFQTGKNYLDAASRRVLDLIAEGLRQSPVDAVFLIEAHTDNQGGTARNQWLSENRADATRHYLLLRGVGPNQLQTKGFGESSPIRSNDTAAGRKANRRITLKRIH